MKVLATQVINTEMGHNKFYRVFVCQDEPEAREIRNWGRIGTRGQFQTIYHSGMSNAAASANFKIAEQIQKRGYRQRMRREFEVDDFSPDTLQREWHRTSPQRTQRDPDIDIYYDEDEPNPTYQRVMWEPA